MQKAFFLLVTALVLLGFLISTTFNIYDEMTQLKTNNQKISIELTQLRADYETTTQERDKLKIENTALKAKLDELQQVYISENQARLKAEADTAIYKGMMVDMMSNIPTTASSSSSLTDEQVTTSKNITSSVMAPVGVSSLATLILTSFAVSVINQYRKHKKSANLA